LPFYYSKYSWY